MNEQVWMRRALELAHQSVLAGNHPFGALLVLDDVVVVEAENTVNTDSDVTKHAEMNVNNDASMFADCQVFNNSRLYARFGSAYQSNSSKYCLFTCGGDTCRIQGGDGLPIELLEFGIEDFEPTAMDQSEQD